MLCGPLSGYHGKVSKYCFDVTYESDSVHSVRRHKHETDPGPVFMEGGIQCPCCPTCYSAMPISSFPSGKCLLIDRSYIFFP